MEVLAVVIPEFKESEDERIRKEIINFLRSPFVNENITDEKVAPWLAWLEKQEWSEEDESFMQRVISVIRWAGSCTDKYKIINPDGAAELQNWLKSLRPQQKTEGIMGKSKEIPSNWKPSEEQMEALQTVYEYLSTGSSPENVRLSDNLRRLYNQLKKL